MSVFVAGYVVRSGDGYLVDPGALQMIGSRRMPTSAAIGAKRYATPQDAESDMQRLRDEGMEAELVMLKRVPLGDRRGNGALDSQITLDRLRYSAIAIFFLGTLCGPLAASSAGGDVVGGVSAVGIILAVWQLRRQDSGR